MTSIKKPAQVIIATLFLAISGHSAQADWHEFWHNLHVDFHRNNAWPDPFNELDALQVVAPFEVMKRNGWQLHNTIGHDLFRESDGALLAAGSNQVRWIASRAPASRRTVFVLRGYSKSETDARVASVNEALDSFHYVGPKPTVLVTDVAPPTQSGGWATKINREWLENLPDPKLPSNSAAGTQSVIEE